MLKIVRSITLTLLKSYFLINLQLDLQQSVQREFEAQKQIEALRHQIEELIVLSQPQIERVSALESENERLNVLVQEKDIQIKSKEVETKIMLANKHLLTIIIFLRAL